MVDYVLTSEIVVAVVAVVGLIFAGEPALTLPYIPLALCFFDNGHPGVNEDKDRQTDDPLDGDQDQIDPTQQDEPQTAVLAVDAGNLNVGTSTLGTLLIDSHDNFLLCFCLIFLFFICF